MRPRISGRNDFEDVRAEFLQKENGNCTQEMFPIKSKNGKTTEFDKAALLSCQAQYALQRNWYPDPIGGLFSYQTWNGMDGFWQNGVAVEALTNAMIYGNHSRYLSVVQVTLNFTLNILHLRHTLKFFCLFYDLSIHQYHLKLLKYYPNHYK